MVSERWKEEDEEQEPKKTSPPPPKPTLKKIKTINPIKL